MFRDKLTVKIKGIALAHGADWVGVVKTMDRLENILPYL